MPALRPSAIKISKKAEKIMKGFAESFPQNKQFYHKVYKIIIYNIYEKVKHSYRSSLPDLSISPDGSAGKE